MATGFTVDSGIANPMLLSQMAGRGMNLFPMLQETSPLKSIKGYSDLFHGTTSAPEIMKDGFTTSKVFASPDYNEALKYAKKGPLSGTKYGAVTGDVLKTKVPTAQLEALLKRGLTGGQEVVLNPQEATKIFQQGSGNIKGTASLISRLGKRALPYLRTAGKLFNRAPVATAISDALFGTTYTADTARDINKLLGGGKGQQEIDAAKKVAATKTTTSKKQAIKGGAAGASTPQQRQQPKQISRPQQRQQPKQTKRQQRSRSRSSQRRSRFARRAQGGIVSINDMIKSL